jgi:hypothetical protein
MATLWGTQLTGSGTTQWGVASLGVPGASIPATGTHGPAAAYEFLTLPAQNATEVQWLMQDYPSAGTFDMGEDTGFTLTGAPDGIYNFTGILKFDGVSQGLKIHTITIGSNVSLIASNSAQANSTTTATISLAYILEASNSSQNNVSSVGSLSTDIILAGSTSSQANSTTTATISQTHILTVNGNNQTNEASTGALANSITLVGSISDQVNSSSNAIIIQEHILSASNSIQAAISSMIPARGVYGRLKGLFVSFYVGSTPNFT